MTYAHTDAQQRAAIRAEVSALSAFDALEAQQIESVLRWIDSGAPLCRVAKPATPPQHLISYFALFDRDHVLLGDHINAGLWLPNGGHVDPGEHPRATVEREVVEELGVAADWLSPDPQFLSVTETVGKTAGHTDVSIWYALRGSRAASYDFERAEFRQLRW